MDVLPSSYLGNADKLASVAFGASFADAFVDVLSPSYFGNDDKLASVAFEASFVDAFVVHIAAS